MLWRNRVALEDHARIIMLGGLKDAVRSSTRFSEHYNPLDLADFRVAFFEVLSGLRDRSIPAIISCEGLSGRTPGKKGIADYSVAIPLAAAMASCAEEVFGSSLSLTIVYTTREADVWLFSAYRHNLHGYRIVDDFETYRKQFRKAADSELIVAEIGRAIPNHIVASRALETVSSAPLGPASALLDFLELPARIADGLILPGNQNIGPDQNTKDELLKLNRSDLPDQDVKAAKLALKDKVSVAQRGRNERKRSG